MIYLLNSVIIGIACVFLIQLLFFEKRENITGIFLTKPFLSFLFVLAAWRQTGSDNAYATWILAGLILSLAGDVCLIFSSRRMFLSGLVVFLMGHVCYAAAFYTHSTPGVLTWTSLAAVTMVGVGVFLWLRPFLGSMMAPVVAYIIVISLMAAGAASVMGDGSLVTGGTAAGKQRGAEFLSFRHMCGPPAICTARVYKPGARSPLVLSGAVSAGLFRQLLLTGYG